jgi:hypothetical protein
MNLSQAQKDAVAFYNLHYTVIFDSSLNKGCPTVLTDPENAKGRRCRFCGRGKPEASFRKKAHAVPEFLGNKTLISMNECDDCNSNLADKYEDDLSKWSGLMRATSQLKGKHGVPSYKSKDAQIKMGNKGLEIGVVTESLESSLNFDGPFTFEIPVSTPTQPHVPLNAAKALVKIACSLCPSSLLHECQPAIDWLMGRIHAKMSMFPVLFAFTPGPNPYGDGRVIIFKRKIDEKLPFIWLVIGTANFRFQFFLPFSPSDAWMLGQMPVELTVPHFPDIFGESWPHGRTKFYVFDWSGTESVVINQTVSFHVESVIENHIPPAKNT